MQAAINPLTQGSPGIDLNVVDYNLLNALYKAKCAEATWNYKSERHNAY